MNTQEQYIQEMITGIRRQLIQIERALHVKPQDGRPSMEAIIWRTAKHFGVTPEELVGKSQQSHLVEPRHLAMYLCRELTNASYPGIGRIFGRHHTSVFHAIRKQVSPQGPEISEIRNQLIGNRA